MSKRGLGKLTLTLCCALVAAQTAGGCWSRKELESMALIVATGVDLNPGGSYLLTVQVSNPAAVAAPAAGGAGSHPARPPFVTWQAGGRSLPDAIRHVERLAQRRLLWSDCRLLLIGEEAAGAGIAPILDAFMRHYQPRLTQWVFVAPGRAEKALISGTSLESIPAVAVDRQARLSLHAGACAIRNLYQVGSMLMQKSGNAFAGVLKLTPPPAPGPPPPTGGSDQATPTQADFVLEGTAVFREDRLAGYLDDTQTRGLMWLRGEVGSTIITIPCPGDPARTADVRVQRGRTRLEIKPVGERLLAEPRIQLEADVVNLACPQDAQHVALSRAIAAAVAREIEREIRLALARAHALGTPDPFGFAAALERSDPRKWQQLAPQWEQELARVEVRPDIRVRISRVGLITAQPSR
ncbi:MAG: Ger(x)C family spore germination protein [Bacillota bacterium]